MKVLSAVRPVSSAATSSRSCSRRGHEVVGIDNYSKYGKVVKSYDDHPTTTSSRATSATPTLMTEAAQRLRPLHRRRRADRWHLLLPHLRLRPAGDQRADHRLVLRRRDQGAPAGQAAEGHLPELVDGVRVDRRTGPRPRATSARSRRRCRPTVSRSWRSSTSPTPPGTSTSCRTRSCARSTASASARAARSATSRSSPATSSWR